jgi:hypothetical protein
VRGVGAVSPAGWNCEALRGAMARNEPLPVESLARPGWEKPLRVRSVPRLSAVPGFMSHARLRRAGAVSQHAVSAALEALGDDAGRIESGELRLGIIVCILSGIVGYTRRFFQEATRDPALASPLIFPETVFNAPASHVAAFLGTASVNYTLVGDDGMFLQALAVAALWLQEGRVNGCLIIGIEELDWLVPDALHLFVRNAVHSSGAGCVYVSGEREDAVAQLAAVTDSFSFTVRQGRDLAARRMRAQLPPSDRRELLCSAGRGLGRTDAAENAAWADWTGFRMTPKVILGEAFAASAAWQCVNACLAIKHDGVAAANVSIVGVGQQAVGARFLPVSKG